MSFTNVWFATFSNRQTFSDLECVANEISSLVHVACDHNIDWLLLMQLKNENCYSQFCLIIIDFSANCYSILRVRGDFIREVQRSIF